MIRHFCLAAALLVCLAVPSTSSAFWPYLGYGGYGYGGLGYYAPPTDYRPAPPYYSLYPPVYYGPNITARHYGASPFAWYPGMSPITYTEAVEPAAAPDPVIIENPFVAGAKSTGAKTTKLEVKPLKIQNPFIVRATR